MKSFIHEDFLLQNKPAARLYHEYAEKMPIFDFHCHLNPKEIYENRQYHNLTEIWLEGDHYKWRLLRANGVEEAYITGEAGARDKFEKWAETLPEAVGNPLYHWSHLELKRYFDIDTTLSPAASEAIWQQSGEALRGGKLNTQDLIIGSNVKAVCTTDDPADELTYHKKIKNELNLSFEVLPTFRPDKALNVGDAGFRPWIKNLESSSGITINDFNDLYNALEKRAEEFKKSGCVSSDHSFFSAPGLEIDASKANCVLQKALRDEPITPEEVLQYQSCLMQKLGRLYHRLHFVMQLHLGVIRNNNTSKFKTCGPDTGFDATGNSTDALSLVKLLDGLEKTDELPKTILYCMNPSDFDMLSTVCGCFQGPGSRGKIQFGAAWWYNDTKSGMIKQLTTLTSTSLLGNFVGMLTDSRSFLSYARHEYFRRILCNLLGEWVEAGEVPEDYSLLGKMVQNICYFNAKNYFTCN